MYLIDRLVNRHYPFCGSRHARHGCRIDGAIVHECRVRIDVSFTRTA